MRKTVAVVAGGNSSEIEVSYKSACQVKASIDTEKYDPYLVSLEGTVWEVVLDDGTRAVIDKNDFSFSVNGEKRGFDVAVIMIHGTPGENGILQSYFDLIGIPYTGCDALCSAITFDKTVCKRVAADTGVSMAKDMLIAEEDPVDAEEITERLGLPVFVKPCRSGSSFGVTKVKTKEDIIPAVNKARTESGDVIVEEFIDGTEVACGIMRMNGRITVFPVTEIVPEREFFDYEAKYEGLSKEITPARIDGQTRQKLAEATTSLYKRLNCSGLVRVDYILKGNEPFFIEVNTIPGMSAQSIVPQQVEAMGMTLTEIYDTLIEEKI